MEISVRPPQAALPVIADRVKKGLARRAELKPYRPAGPITVDVSFKHYMPAEVLAYLPLFERTSSHSIRFRARDMVEATSIMEFIGEYRPDLTP